MTLAPGARGYSGGGGGKVLMEAGIQVRSSAPGDREWAAELLRAAWGGPEIVTCGRVHDARALPGLVAEWRGERAGLAIYRPEPGACELVSLNSLIERRGVGSALLNRVVALARESRCRRLWLITTNDNLPALRFYQRRGFELVAVHRGAIEASRRLKPSIPPEGLEGIPIRDEIELEFRL